ncbi:MAG: DOMON-like domain-containing protein [Methylococcaceae bacterium]|nr:DOMON-like domain-containing protein [Methylococcaceae bacterium]
MLSGNLAKLKIPARQMPAAVDGLWEHTCFEAFVGVEGENRYHEFNFSPSGQYAAYAFSAYRERDEWQPIQVPAISFSEINNRYELKAAIAQTNLPVNINKQSYQLGISAVLELYDGQKSYWAFLHPSERPDFHHRDGFILSINPNEIR